MFASAEFFYSIASVLAVSLISLAGLFVISMKSAGGRRLFLFLVSFAAGALIGDVFVHLLPELAEGYGLTPFISAVILGTVLAFFILEKYLIWHHHHGEGNEAEHAAHPFVYNILVGDSIHNFIDGLVIAGAYQLDFSLGLATTVAVVLHEIPQEIGDFGVLIYGGFTRAKALIYNFISALSAVLGAVLAFAAASLEQALPILVAIGVGSFVYIAMADLIPLIQKEREKNALQLFAFVFGIASMFLLLLLE